MSEISTPAPVPAQPTASKAPSRLGNPTLRRYARSLRTPKGAIGACCVLLLTLLAIATPVLYPGGYDDQTAGALQTPSLAHPFGTDELGRDLLVRTLYGLRTDFSILVVAVPVSTVLGVIIGLTGGVSRTLGALLQRVLDIILGFPGVILGICVVLIFGPGWLSLVVAIAIGGLPHSGRQARAAMLGQMQREYVVAARSLGVGRWTILRRHVLPNIIDPILVGSAMFVVYAIFIEAGLSIIGLGIQPPEPSLGSLLNVGMRFITSSPMYILGPTLVLFVLALAFSLIADALNETVNRK